MPKKKENTKTKKNNTKTTKKVEDKKVKENKLKKFINIRNFLILVLLGIFIFTSTKLTSHYIDLNNNETFNEEIKEEVVEKKQDKETKEEVIKIDFDKLKQKNDKVVGWINYNQNKIDYAIVQGPNNNYYLNKNIEKKYDVAGSIFMDWRNKNWNDKNVILFGHAMDNGSMFGSLKEVINKGYFDKEENNYITITYTNNEVVKYQIFSHYTIEAEEYYITPSFKDTKTFQTFIDTITKRSVKKFDVKVTTEDNILTLSTCAGTGNTTKRRVIHAKKIDSQKETTK